MLSILNAGIHKIRQSTQLDIRLDDFGNETAQAVVYLPANAKPQKKVGAILKLRSAFNKSDLGEFYAYDWLGSDSLLIHFRIF